MKYEKEKKDYQEDVSKDIIKDLERRISLLENVMYEAKQILTLEEAAAFIGVSRSQLYKLTHLHVIPYYKPSGKLVYFEKSELLSWIRQNPVKSQKQIDDEAQTVIQWMATK